VAAADFLLAFLNFVVAEFYDFAAFEAHEVVVMAVPEYMFVVRVAFAESFLPQQFRLNEQRQRAVQRSPRYTRHVLQKLLGLEMIVA